MGCLYGCAKCYLKFSVFIMTVLGIGAIVLGSIQLNTQNSVWNLSGFEWQNYISYLIIFSGVALLLLSLFGIFGAWKKSKCGNCVFIFGMIPLFLVFLGLGIFATAYSGQYYDDLQDFQNGHCLNDQNLKTNWLFNYQLQYDLAILYFGKTNTYPQCVANIQANSQQYQMAQKEGLTEIGPLGEQNAIECLFQYGQSKSQLDALNTLESVLSCSGICTNPNLYYFSNINSGIPGSTCLDKFQDILSDYGLWIGISSFILSFLLLLNVISSFAVCCHPDHKGKSLYHRMSYED